MKRIKKTVLSIFIAIWASVLVAQELPRQTYFFMGIAFSSFKTKDEAHSPLTYKGSGLTFRVGFEEINPNFVARFAANISVGGASPKLKPRQTTGQSSFSLNNIDILYSHYRRINGENTEGWQNYAGGTFYFTFDTRAYTLPSNNLNGFQINMGLNGGVFLNKNIGSDWRFNYEPNATLLAYSIRPNYIGLPETEQIGRFSLKSLLRSGRFATVNRFFRFQNRFSFDQQVKEWRQNRFYYAWDWTNNQTAAALLQSVHSHLGYETLFKL
ncbi:MAG: hypothetical protein HC817_14805 [Saprospiraceae bacterium]|nr:hypothetical protein [Saprospiraceae bacterium]